MIDREKVIKGLEWCMNEKHDCYREKGCPYENEGEDIGCKYALHRDALALLKAQEPRTVSSIIKVHECTLGKCPTCGADLMDYYNEEHCGICGQAVKWDG